MTPEQFAELVPGQILYMGYLSIDPDHDPLLLASIRVAEVAADRPVRSGDYVSVDVHPRGTGEKRRKWVATDDVFLTRSAAIRDIQRQFREHLEECDRFAVELDGMLAEALKGEATP